MGSLCSKDLSLLWYEIFKFMFLWEDSRKYIPEGTNSSVGNATDLKPINLHAQAEKNNEVWDVSWFTFFLGAGHGNKQ